MLSRRTQVLLNTITKLLRKRMYQRVRDIVQRVHLADLATIFRFLSDEFQDILFDQISSSKDRAELIEYLDDPIVERLMLDYSSDLIADLIVHMSDDDATDLLQRCPEEKVKAILPLLKKDEREDIQNLIQYEEETAGGLMTTDFVAIPSLFTAKQALEVIQDYGEEAETMFYLYAIDDEGRLEGVLTLRELVQAPENDLLESFMVTDIHKVRPNHDQEDVARTISNYDLLAVPVVDEENHIIGIITVDDIIDVIREEATEDILKLVGADEEVLDDYSVKRNIISRLPWLFATWIAGILIMRLIGTYEAQLKQVVALASFFPIILGMSGNVGQQSATIIVRGIAIGKVDVSQLMGTITKEATTGLVIGLVYGLALGGIAWFEFGDKVAMVPIVVGVSQMIAIIIAATYGSFVPMFLSRLRVDPAVATGPIVTTSLDLVAIWIYLTIATWLIF